MQDHEKAVVTYYDTHPINEAQILEKLALDGHDLDTLTEAVLQNYDQDHYGGFASTECLASEAEIVGEHHVLDVCSGMGGPARYLAFHKGCRVTGLDLTESRVEGAANLTKLAGLNQQVEYCLGDAQMMPFEASTFDVAISQEALLHVPDKAAVIAECSRVLKPGGVIAFTDLARNERLSSETMAKLGPALASVNFATMAAYRYWLDAHEFEIVEAFDRSEELKAILTERLSMYKKLGNQTRDRFGAEREKEWEDGYSFFVETVVAGGLGGCRFVARKTD